VTHLFIGVVGRAGKMLLKERQQALVFGVQIVQQRAINVGDLGLGGVQYLGGMIVVE
jgi:hypothetical protein